MQIFYLLFPFEQTIAKSPEKMAIPAKSETKNEQKDIFEELFESKNAVTKNALPALSSIQDSKTFPAESFSDPLSLTTTSNKPQSKPAESTIPSKDPLAADNEFIKDTPDVTVANAHLVKEKVRDSDVCIIDCVYIYVDFLVLF